jgi:hypothetical protein
MYALLWLLVPGAWWTSRHDYMLALLSGSAVRREFANAYPR